LRGTKNDFERELQRNPFAADAKDREKTVVIVNVIVRIVLNNRLAK